MSHGNNPSAGVYVNEIDLSQYVVAAPTSIGAIVGASARGPVGQRTLVTSQKQFLQMFGVPDASDRKLPQQPVSHYADVANSYMHYCALAFLNEATRLYVTRVAPGATFGGLTCSFNPTGNAPFNFSQSWTSGQDDPTIYPFAPTDLFAIYAVDPGKWNSELSIQIYPETQVDDGTFYVAVFKSGVGMAVETHKVSLNHVVDGYGTQRNIQEYINSRSMYIRVVQNYENADFMTNPNRRLVNSLNAGGAGGSMGVDLVGGDDGYQPTIGDMMNAWDLYADPEVVDVNMLINGGYAFPAIQIKMAQLCQDRMDCVAILDTPSTEQTVQNALNYRRNTLNLDSSYAALYSPDVLILDQYNDKRLYIPISGHVAAAYARTDRDWNLWFAPAGMNRGKLDVLGVRHIYNQGDRDALYESQINAVRVINGSGIKIWGADTMQVMGSALSNMSVRRLMIFLEKSLSKAALYSLFDPNDQILRNQLIDLCERFLRPIMQGRGVYGYYVKCDAENNPPEIIANGDLILDVYIDPTLPVKRIHLTAVVNRTGSRVTGTATNQG